MLISLVIGILIGCCLMMVAFSYHIVVAEDTTLFVPKQNAEISNVYVDIRKWTSKDWSENPDISAAMVKAGHSDRIKTTVASDLIDGLFRGLQKK